MMSIKKRNLQILLATITLISGLAGLFQSDVFAKGDKKLIAVIVNQKNKIENLSIADLRAIFLRQKRHWPNGSPIMILNLKSKTSLRTQFDKLVLKMSPEKASAYWIRERIQGKGQPPWSAASQTVTQAIVAKQSQAISYVSLGDTRENVKVVKVDGKLPTDKDYPLVFQGN